MKIRPLYLSQVGNVGVMAVVKDSNKNEKVVNSG